MNVVAGGLSALGFVTAEGLGTPTARLAAFTLGVLITMLTTSMIPHAYEKGGRMAGIWPSSGTG